MSEATIHVFDLEEGADSQLPALALSSDWRVDPDYPTSLYRMYFVAKGSSRGRFSRAKVELHEGDLVALSPSESFEFDGEAKAAIKRPAPASRHAVLLSDCAISTSIFFRRSST